MNEPKSPLPITRTKDKSKGAEPWTTAPLGSERVRIGEVRGLETQKDYKPSVSIMEDFVNLTWVWQTGLQRTKTPSYQHHHFPSKIISHAVWLYHRFYLSFREVEELLTERGITVTYETVRQWCQKFGPDYARKLKQRQGRLGDTWHIDEAFVTIQGKRQYLW